MRIAVINEVSARARNSDILLALSEHKEHTFYNVGMSAESNTAELTYIQTGLMAGALINCNACDFIIGGCGTGQGFLVSAMQYPGMFCGLISDPLDGWLFSQINGGNCISLPLNKGYGWAGDLNLKLVFRELFRDPPGAGYPPHRSESQAQSRAKLAEISYLAHNDFKMIFDSMDREIIHPLNDYSIFLDLLREAEKQELARDLLASIKNA